MPQAAAVALTEEMVRKTGRRKEERAPISTKEQPGRETGEDK